jgi:HSP20 family molecular chaperone IbpA
MSSVAVQKIAEPEKTPSPALVEMRELFEKIRKTAFEIFQRNGSVDGHDVDHWVEAERAFLCCPASELVEKDHRFEFSVAAPGLEPNQIQVTVLPDSIIVKGQTTTCEEKKQGSVHFSEFSDRQLLRRLIFPKPIDVSSASARLENGLLRVVVQKAAPSNKTAAAA